MVRVPAIGEANVTDATRAGDLFVGGFLYGLMKGLSLEECCRVGTCSGCVCYLGCVCCHRKTNSWNGIRNIQLTKDCILIENKFMFCHIDWMLNMWRKCWLLTLLRVAIYTIVMLNKIGK